MEYLVLGWLLCGFVSMGMGYNYLQNKYPTIAHKHRLGNGVFVILTGLFSRPINFMIVLFLCARSGLWGWKLPFKK